MNTLLVISTGGHSKREYLINRPVPNQPQEIIASGMSGLDRCLSDHCVLLFKCLWKFQDKDIRSNTKYLTKWHCFVRYRVTEKVTWNKSLQCASVFLEGLTFPHVNTLSCYLQTNRMRHCLMWAAESKLAKRSTAAQTHIWLHGTQPLFLRSRLCILSTSGQMIAMDQLLVLDTSFHSLINCVAAVQNLCATKCNFLSLGRRLV